MATEAEYGKWLKWLEAIEMEGVNLSPREEEFIESTRERFNKWGSNVTMSDKQEAWLEDIYINRCP